MGDSKWIQRVNPYQIDLHLNKLYLRKDHVVYMGREDRYHKDMDNYYNSAVIKDATHEQTSRGLEVANSPQRVQ